jgi:hypothetical protein
MGTADEIDTRGSYRNARAIHRAGRNVPSLWTDLLPWLLLPNAWRSPCSETSQQLQLIHREPTLYPAPEDTMDQSIVKTRQQWAESHQNLGQFLKVGDPVDGDFVEWARDIMPPAHWSGQMIQIGEPHDHIEGRATYATFYMPNGGSRWTFGGYCWRRETKEPHAA